MRKALSKLKKPIIFTILAVLVVMYYIHLTHKDVDNTDKLAQKTDELLSKDMSKNYPSDYYDVVEYFLDMQKIVYKEDLSEDALVGYAQHMRATWDNELIAREGNDYETYLTNFKNEVERFKDTNKYINEYKLQRRRDTITYTIGKENYAEVTAKYYMMNDGELVTFYEKYTLRKDLEDKWKILYWEKTDGSEMEE